MHFSKYLKLSFIVTPLLIGIILSTNYIVDRYGVFHGKKSGIYSYEPNTRVIKMKSLMNTCNDIESIVFGTSRSVAYRTNFIKNSYNLTSYNMGVSSESYIGIFKKLQWLVNNNCVPKIIFIPVSADHLRNYSRDYSTIRPLNLLRLDHPMIVNNHEYSTIFYRSYLLSYEIFLDNLKQGIKYVIGHNQKNIIKYNFSTGDVYYLWDERFDTELCKKPDKNYSKISIKKAVYNIKKIKNISDNNNIKVVLLWNPSPLYTQIGHENISTFLSMLLPMFENIHRLPLSDIRLQDDIFYHDPSHFKDLLAKDVLLDNNYIKIQSLIDEIHRHRKTCVGDS